MVQSPAPCPASDRDGSRLSVSLALPGTLQAPSVARRATREVLSAWGLHEPEWADDACLVVTELVSNAVRHGGPRLALELSFAGGWVMVAVVDSTCGVPQPRTPADDDESGRGMLIVTALARSWGVDTGADGKRVWARLNPPSPGPRPGLGRRAQG